MDEWILEILRDPVIKTCFKRSALGLLWEKSQSGGNSPYLCTDNFGILVQEIVQEQNVLMPLIPNQFYIMLQI